MASEAYIGKICPYCLTKLTTDDNVILCSQCEMPHHAECWRANRGCTTYACNGLPVKDSGREMRRYAGTIHIYDVSDRTGIRVKPDESYNVYIPSDNPTRPQFPGRNPDIGTSFRQYNATTACAWIGAILLLSSGGLGGFLGGFLIGAVVGSLIDFITDSLSFERRNRF